MNTINDIIHIHWINQGFISLKSLSNIKKPTIWTMRDMWAFTGIIMKWILKIMKIVLCLILLRITS